MARAGLAATASFTDVPDTHPYFQYIEQMKARGITTGCAADPPRFCPEDPATRGQVAAFLMRAIGSGSTGNPPPESGSGIQIFGQTFTPQQLAIGGGLLAVALLLGGRR